MGIHHKIQRIASYSVERYQQSATNKELKKSFTRCKTKLLMHACLVWIIGRGHSEFDAGL